MKKEYLVPIVEALPLHATTPLCSSLTGGGEAEDLSDPGTLNINW